MNMIERCKQILADGKKSLNAESIYELRRDLERATTHAELDAIEQRVAAFPD